MEIKLIRAEYKGIIANAGSVTGGVFALFGKRKIAGHIRADSKRAMTKDRDSKTSPYEELKLYIDKLIYQLDSAKLTLENYILNN